MRAVCLSLFCFASSLSGLQPEQRLESRATVLAKAAVQILQASEDDFKSIKGAKLSDVMQGRGKRWKPAIKLPGGEKCEILEWATEELSPSYTCQGDDSSKFGPELLEALRKALGSKWVGNLRKNPDTGQTSVYFLPFEDAKDFDPADVSKVRIFLAYKWSRWNLIIRAPEHKPLVQPEDQNPFELLLKK